MLSNNAYNEKRFESDIQASLDALFGGGGEGLRQMKDSGIEWIGEIPVNWNTIPFRHILKERQEKNNPVKTEERLSLSIDLGVTLYAEKTTNLDRFKDDFEQYKIAHIGDLVMNSMNMIVGATGVSNYYGCVSPVYYTFYDELPDHATAKYCEYIFRSKTMLRVLYSLGKGIYAIVRGDDRVNTCRLKVAKEDLKSIIIPQPSIDEQRAIIHHLDSQCAHIDNIIEKTKASIEEYKKLRQAVITQAVTKGVRGDRPMKDSGIEWIGEIPEEWQATKIKWLLTEQKERSETGEEEPLSMSQKFGIIPTKEMDIVPNMASSFVGAKLVGIGDLVFNKLKAHLGVFAVSGYAGLVSPDYAVYRSTGKANLRFLEYMFKTPQCINEFKKKSTGVGAGLTRLYTDGLYSIYIPLPPMNEQREIAKYIDTKCTEIDSLISKKEQFLTELESYKKSMIYEYVTGKKEVPQS